MQDSAEVIPTMIREEGSLQTLNFDSPAMSDLGFLGQGHVWKEPLSPNKIFKKKPTSQMGLQRDGYMARISYDGESP